MPFLLQLPDVSSPSCAIYIRLCYIMPDVPSILSVIILITVQYIHIQDKCMHTNNLHIARSSIYVYRSILLPVQYIYDSDTYTRCFIYINCSNPNLCAIHILCNIYTLAHTYNPIFNQIYELLMSFVYIVVLL